MFYVYLISHQTDILQLKIAKKSIYLKNVQKNFDCGFLLIKSSFSSCPKTDKFLNEIIDYGSQWQLLVLSPYYSIQCCLKVFVSICCFTANKALRHSQYQKNHNLHKCDHDLIQPSRIFQARIGTIHLERPQFAGRRGQMLLKFADTVVKNCRQMEALGGRVTKVVADHGFEFNG
mgnify:CR=1 FL=1